MNPFDNLQSVSYRLGLVSATLRSKGLENKDSPILTSLCVLQLPFSYQHCFFSMENDFPNPEWIGPQRYGLYKIWSMTISIMFPVLGIVWCGRTQTRNRVGFERIERKKPLNLRGNPVIKERETLSNSEKKETNNIIGEKIKRYTGRASNSLARNSKKIIRKIMETLLYSTFLPFFFFLFILFSLENIWHCTERERERTSIIVLFSHLTLSDL